MALVECSECGASVSNKAKTCVKCGAPVVAKQTKEDVRNGLGAIVAIAVVFAIGMAYIKFDGWRTERRTNADLAKRAKQREAAAATNCKKTPQEIFPIGERYESETLSRLLDENFKHVEYSPSRKFQVNCAGTIYSVQTEKVDDNRPGSAAQYRIMSIEVR